jgi:hypothetical protein
MKKHLLLICTVLLAAACSSPKYAYHFDHYDYNSGKKQASEKAVASLNEEQSPLTLQEETLVASADEKPVALSETKENHSMSMNEAKATFAKKYKAMSKEEKKAFKKELKTTIKSYMKAKKSGDHVGAANATKAMDHDLKLAIIFGAVGLTLTLFGGVNSVFWVLGVISIVIGVVFLIMWLSRQ